MQLLKYIPLQLTSCLILGILVGFYWNPDTQISIAFLLSSLISLGLLYFYSKKALNRSIYFMSTVFFVFFFIGIASITFHKDLNREHHYTTFLSEEHPTKAILKITAVLKPNDYYTKYEGSVLKINDQKVQGKILVNLYRDSLENKLEVDDRLFVNTSFLNINASKNPYQFNYQNYLEKQHIYRQITIYKGAFIMLESSRSSLKGLANRFRVNVNNKLLKNGFKDDELAIVNALLLGQRQELSKELIENYSKAGAMHILAVSGLHVGIIMLLISFLLKPLKRIKNGKLIHTVILILSLWVFAFIAGMSASVVRAVTMFTALSIGLVIDRKNSVYKNLIISLFVLLLFNPYYLFEVGFQLSYLAVFFIVWMQPIIYRSWKPKWRIADYFWQLFTVSLAAQLGVLPLSLYYFHQFPGLFFITNLMIIPVLGMILGLGIFVIVVSILNVAPSFLTRLYYEIISTMNTLISWIAQQESFLLQEISFSLTLVISSYLFLIFFFRWIEQGSIYKLKHALFAFIILQGAFIYEKYQSTATNEFVVFNKNKTTAFAIKKRNIISVYTPNALEESDPMLKSYKTGSNIHNMNIMSPSKDLYQIDNKRVLIIDSLGIYKLNSLNPDYILLSQSPPINLERLIDELRPKFIIADASNYKSYVKHWQETCLNNKVRFHYTGEDGAFLENF